jgi:hypothetical protein
MTSWLPWLTQTAWTSQCWDAGTRRRVSGGCSRFLVAIHACLLCLQAGTPRVELETKYEPGSQTLTIKASQSTPATPGQPTKLPVLIPVSVGLLGPDGGWGRCSSPC